MDDYVVEFCFLKVPAYVACQVIGSTLAAGTIRLIFQGKQDHFTGTMPAGSDLQSFVVEFIITFYLMFIISGVATDNRAVRSNPYPNHKFQFQVIDSIYSVLLRRLVSLLG